MIDMEQNTLQDQLPKGFKFRGLINAIPKSALTSSGFSTSSNPWNYNTLGSYYSGFNTINYTEYLTNNSNYLPVATVSDGEKAITYKNAKISASTGTDGDDHQQVKFTFSRYSNNDSYLRYDASLSKYYLNPGEAVRFGYICTVEGFARTENIANNEIAMPVYDKYGFGAQMSGEDVVITPANFRDISSNDGDCAKLTTEEEVTGRRHEKSSWVKSTTEWFSSNVSMQRLAPVPGVLKTVGGETYIASNVTIKPDEVYGTKYTSGDKGGTPYTGTVARTSIVNWNIKAYNEGGIGSNSMEDFWIIDTVDAPYKFTGNYFYDYYSVNGTKMTNDSVPVFSLGGRSENDTKVKYSSGQGSSTLTLDKELTINGDPVSVDGGRAEIQLLRDNETGQETLRIHFNDNYHRIPPNSYMSLYAHTQYVSSDAVLSKQFYNHVQLEPGNDFDPSLVSQGKVLYEDVDGDMLPYAIESGASVTMTAGYSSAARKQVTEIGNTSNTAWSDRNKNSILLPEKFSKFYYDLYVDLPKDDPTSKLVLIDALPEPGDHSPFVDRDMRDSEFVVRMLGEDLGLNVWTAESLGTGTKHLLGADEYTFEVSSKHEFVAADWDGLGEGWTAVDFSDGFSDAEKSLINNARSFRIIIHDDDLIEKPLEAIMGKNYQVQVRFNAELESPEEADPGTTAWNSFGYRYTVPIGATGISTSLNAEPLKVGVQIPSVPFIIKDQKTPNNHYKPIDASTEYKFLIYTGTAIAELNDVSEMSMSDIAAILSANSREVLVTSLTVNAAESSGQTDFLDEEKKWSFDSSENNFVPTEDNWIWVNSAKYTVIELPWSDNGFHFQDIQHGPVNNYTFVQNTNNNVTLRVTNVYGEKGNLKIEKTVQGPAFDPERRFTFTIHLQDGRYPVYGTYEYTGTNIRDGSITFDDAGNASIQLKHDQAIEIKGIPAGYTYTVSESEDPWYSAESENASGIIPSENTVTASFINTRKDTSLIIKKIVRGNFGNKSEMFDFEIYVTAEGRELTGEYDVQITRADNSVETSRLSFTNGAAVVQLSHGDIAVVSGLPVGARFEVDELAASRVGYEYVSTLESGVFTDEPATSQWTNIKDGTIASGVYHAMKVWPITLIVILMTAWFFLSRKIKTEN